MYRKAFSIMELIAVLSILAIIASLAVKGVGALRQSSRRMTCQSRLKEIALACHLHESARGYLPEGFSGPNANNYQGLDTASWLGSNAFLIPYLGLPSHDLDASRRNAWWLDIDTDRREAEIITSRWLQFQCPSDANRAKTRQTICAVYIKLLGHRSVGIGLHVSNSLPLVLSSGNFFGNMGLAGKVDDPLVDSYMGPFYNRSRTRLRDFQRGTSHVILYGEAIGQQENIEKQDNTALAIHWCSGPLSVVPRSQVRTMSFRHFNSFHPSGLNYAFGDGSVRATAYSTDDKLILDLGSLRNRN